MNPIFFAPPPPPPPRDCIVADGHRYCRDEDLSAREGGVLLLVVLAIIAWAAWPIYDDTRDTPHWNWTAKKAVAWYAGPIIAIALLLLVFGQ